MLNWSSPSTQGNKRTVQPKSKREVIFDDYEPGSNDLRVTKPALALAAISRRLHSQLTEPSKKWGSPLKLTRFEPLLTGSKWAQLGQKSPL